MKWANKKELMLFEQEISAPQSETIVEPKISKQKEIESFIDYLETLIESELNRKARSATDDMIKCSVALAHEKDKRALLNIINGYKWDKIPEYI